MTYVPRNSHLNSYYVPKIPRFVSGTVTARMAEKFNGLFLLCRMMM